VGQEKLRENKLFRAETAANPARTLQLKRKPLTPEMMMQTDAPVHKLGGRLSREDQRRLGDILQRVYDEVIRQGVPDRFKQLLGELDQRENASPAQRGIGQSGANDIQQPGEVLKSGGVGESKRSAR
jgi:hypothetical protein